MLHHAVLRGQAEANGYVAFSDSSSRLRLDVLFFLPHQAGARHLAFLDVPVLLDGFCDLLLLQLFDNMLAGLLIADQDLRSHIHLQLLLGHVVDGVPQLRIRLLGVARVLEVDRALHGQLLEQQWLLKRHLTCVFELGLTHGLVGLELDLLFQGIARVSTGGRF